MNRVLLTLHCLVVFIAVSFPAMSNAREDTQNAQQYPRADNVVDGPTSMAITDLNRDKTPELVITNRHTNTVSVLLNNGSGSLSVKSRYATGLAPAGVAASDLNRDGKQDVVVVNSGSDSVSVFLGKGDGTFTRGKDFSAGAVPSAIVIGNLNRDNVSDLVLVNRYGGSVSVLLGRGDGSFAAKTDYPTGRLPYSVALSDVNRDGKEDLLVTSCFDHTVWMLEGNGDGTFYPKARYATAKRGCSVVVGNLGIDGAAVIEPHRYGYLVSIQLVNHDGTPKDRRELLSGKGPRGVIAADLNGDGSSDLAVANAGHNPGEPGSVFVFLGRGTGAFESKASYVTGNASHSLGAGDLNGDGKLDIAVLNGSYDFGGSVSVLFGKGDGTFGGRADYATGGYQIWVSFGDDANKSRSEQVETPSEKPPEK